MLGSLPRGTKQQQRHGGKSSSKALGAPDFLSSLKPCTLPEDMPLPVSSSRAAAAAAADADGEDDSGGFDWHGLARSKQQQQQVKRQQQQDAAEAVAAASKRIALIASGIKPEPAPAPPSVSKSSRAKPAASAAAAAAADGESRGPVEGTDALGRKVWDKEYYQRKAQEKASALGGDEFLDLLPRPREKPKPPPLPPCGYRQQLQPRAFKLDFEREVGRTKMVTLQTPRMQQGGFWCDICECLCKDSQAYLDHINGRNHNRILGMSMRVERVPLPRVKAKLQAARRELAAEAEGAETLKEAVSKTMPAGAPVGAIPGGSSGALEAEDEFDRVKKRIEELQKEQELKRQRKKEKKKAAAAAAAAAAAGGDGATTCKAENPDAAALAAMGLPTSFIGS